jgi:hypothetical protein
MFMLVTIVVVSAAAAVAACWLPVDQFKVLLQPLIVALSIMAAGLLVRLNRGMPTLDWKSLDTSERKKLTAKIVELTREYMVVLGIQLFALAVLLTLAVLDPTKFSPPVSRGFMALAGGAVGLCLARMAYIVWRDYDIVRLQRKLIDDSADREALEKAHKDALDRVSAIREAGLRSPPKPEQSGWSDKA